MPFLTLKRKTMFRIIMPILLGLFLVCITILTVVSRSYFRIYERNAKNHIATKENAVKLFLHLIEEASMQYSFDRTNPVLTLDLLRQSNKNILAAAFLIDRNTYYVSSNVKGFPEYTDLISLPEVLYFPKKNDNSRWFIRNRQIAEYYDNKKYDKRSGMLTYLRKESGGTLMLDIKPSSIFSILENQNDLRDATLQNGNIFLCSDPARTITSEEQECIESLISGGGTNTDLRRKNSRIYRISVADSIIATTEISYDYVWDQILLLVIILLPIFILFSILTFLIASILTNTIIHPLEFLRKKMEHEKLSSVTGYESVP